MALTYWPITNAQITEDLYEQVTAWGQIDGLVGHPDDDPLIYADGSGRQIKWRANRFGRNRGFGFKTAAVDEATAIDANVSGATRIDLAVVRLNRVDWTVSGVVIPGTPGNAAPSQTTDDDPDSGVWEFPVGEITVASGASNLLASTVKARGWYIGPGCVLCTSTTRPPVADGLRIHETNTARQYIGVGPSWRLLSADTGEFTVNASLSGWEVNVDSVMRFRNGHVDLRLGTWKRTGGQISGGGEVRLPVNIPSAYRPISRDRRVTVRLTGNDLGRAVVYSSVSSRAGQVWLDSFSSAIGTNHFVNGMDMSWVVA